MLVEDIFDINFYPALKEYVETNNIYNAKVVKVNPQDSKVFPIIPVKLLPRITNRYNNLNYGEETYSFGIEIDIYAVNTTVEQTTLVNEVETTTYEKVSKKTVCDNLTRLIVDYIKDNYHFTVHVTHDAPNIDTNVHRNIIQLNGVLDTKYGNDNLVIYPTLR
jgi:hypothetical protein